MGDVLRFPGAGTPAPGGHPARPMADLDGIGDRYTALLEARAAKDWTAARLLEGACADDIPACRDEIARVESLRAELAAEVDRLLDLLAVRGGGVDG